MKLGRASWLLMIAGCALPFAVDGCSNSTKALSPDAAADVPMSTGGTPSGGVSGMGGGSAGSSARDSGGAMGGGAGGSGGRAPAGGVTGSGGAAGFGGSARTGGASGYGGIRDGGDVDSPIAIGTDGYGSLDGGPDGDSGLHCVGTASPRCLVACNTPGCRLAIPPGAGCSGSPAPCSSNSTSTTCGANPGCVWLPPGSCSGTPSHCDERSLAADCAGQPGCTWTPLLDGGTCIAAPDPCSENLSQAKCSAQTGCTWSNAVCLTGACSVNTTSAACQATGCSWYGAAACTGTAYSCTKYSSYSECYNKSGCSWTSPDMNCYGTPTSCGQLSIATCAQQPGCTVSTP